MNVYFQALEGLKFQNKQTPKQTNRTFISQKKSSHNYLNFHVSFSVTKIKQDIGKTDWAKVLPQLFFFSSTIL